MDLYNFNDYTFYCRTPKIHFLFSDRIANKNRIYLSSKIIKLEAITFVVSSRCSFQFVSCNISN